MSTSDPLAPLRQALDFSAAQARRVLDLYPGYTPMYTVGGRWNREGERWTHWCEGFFPGVSVSSTLARAAHGGLQ